MADPKIVAKKDGKAFRTHKVKVEDGYFVAPDYELRLFEEQKISATGLLKVLELVPSDPRATDPSFIGRWDEKANHLDIDATDANGNIDKSVRFTGHHPAALPDRRFAVEIRTDGGKLVFKGIVSFGLGREVLLEAGAIAVTGFKAELIHGTAAEPGSVSP
jgi:hypothetical protein